MKKIFVAFLLLVGLALFSQNKSISEVDGNDWMSFNDDQKTGVAIGFMLGNTMIINYMMEMVPANTPDDQKKQYLEKIKSQFFYDTSVAELVKRVDQGYIDYRQRKYLLWQVILGMYSKDWWNHKSVPIGPSS